MIGIYAIRNKVTKHIYIGESLNVGVRWSKHIEDLETEKHHSYKLQQEWNEYDVSNFAFKIIEDLTPSKDMKYEKGRVKVALLCRELYYIKKYDTIENGFNIKETLKDIIAGHQSDEIDTSNLDKEKIKEYIEENKWLLNDNFTMDKYFEFVSNDKGTRVLTKSDFDRNITLSKVLTAFVPYYGNYHNSVINYILAKQGYMRFYYTGKDRRRWFCTDKAVEKEYFYKANTRFYVTWKGFLYIEEICKNLDKYLSYEETYMPKGSKFEDKKLVKPSYLNKYEEDDDE